MPTSGNQTSASADLPLPTDAIEGALPIDPAAVITALEVPGVETEGGVAVPEPTTDEGGDISKPAAPETRTLDQIVKDAQAVAPSVPSGPPN
jgi:hypothetical protein